LDADRYQWLQVDLGSRKQVVAIATQGRYGSSDWTSKYRLLYSDTQKNWRPYLQDGNIWVGKRCVCVLFGHLIKRCHALKPFHAICIKKCAQISGCDAEPVQPDSSGGHQEHHSDIATVMVTMSTATTEMLQLKVATQSLASR